MVEWRPGIAYALAASLAVSVSSALVKSSTLPIGQTGFCAGLAVTLVGLPVASCQPEPLFPRGRRLGLALFALLSGAVLLADYQALRLMPLADEVVVSYASIVFTVLLAKVFLKERCGRGRLGSTLLVLAGVGLISEQGLAGPASYPRYGFGCLLTLTGALFDGATYILIKGLADLHLSVILLSCGWASMLLAVPLQLLVETWTIPSEPFILLLIILLTILQEAFLCLAFTTGEDVGLISLVQATDIVFSYVWEVSFFHESQSVLRIVGACLVSGGVCLAAFTSEGGEGDLALARYNRLKEAEELEALPLVNLEEAKETSLAAVEVVKWLRSGKLEV